MNNNLSATIITVTVKTNYIYKMEEKRIYLNEYDRESSERKMKYIADSKTLKIDWEKEMERQKYNSQDHPPKEKMNNKELVMLKIKQQTLKGLNTTRLS